MQARRPVPALLATVVFAASALAQSLPNLISLTRITPLIAQNDHASCTPLANCAPIGMPASLPFAWSGGTAYDGRTDTVWVTSGQLLGRYAMNACTVSCPPGPCPKSSLTAEATGLDVVDSLNQLWIMDDAGIITRCTNSCPPTIIGSCNTGLALAGFVANTGIAVDDARGVVFFCRGDFAFGSGQIYAATMANPCAPFSVVPTVDMFSNPDQITGVAVDWGRSVLYWTDGRNTFEWAYTFNPSGPSIVYTPLSFCLNAAPLGDPYTDLSIRAGAATPSGGPCASPICTPCPMNHVLRNAPVLGTTLGLGLDNAQANSVVWCLLSFGPCMSGGTTFPPLCGPLLTPLVVATLGPNLTGGTTGCTGATTFPVGLPLNPALAGAVLSTQCIGLCSGTGVTMSNCLSWMLVGI